MNRCTMCGDKYPDSSPYPACTQVCAARLACVFVADLQARGLDFRQIIPTAYPGTGEVRPDLVPWPEWRDAQASAERLGQKRKLRWGD